MALQCHSCGSAEKCLNSEYILMVYLIGFPDELDLSIKARELESWMTLRLLV